MSVFKTVSLTSLWNIAAGIFKRFMSRQSPRAESRCIYFTPNKVNKSGSNLISFRIFELYLFVVYPWLSFTLSPVVFCEILQHEEMLKWWLGARNIRNDFLIQNIMAVCSSRVDACGRLVNVIHWQMVFFICFYLI